MSPDEMVLDPWSFTAAAHEALTQSEAGQPAPAPEPAAVPPVRTIVLDRTPRAGRRAAASARPSAGRRGGGRPRAAAPART